MTVQNEHPPAIVTMGVSGSGKTTIGEEIAARLGVPFRDADEFHPRANVEKMSSGIALTDEDRAPWLDAIGAAIRDADPERPVVVSCSALRRAYRDRIRAIAGRRVDFVFLHGDEDTLRRRMAGRKGHFMPSSLLASQLATLEPPTPDEQAIAVAVDQPITTIVDEVLDAIQRRRCAA